MNQKQNGETLAELMSEKMNSQTFRQILYKNASSNGFSFEEAFSLILKHSETLESFGLNKAAAKLLETAEIFIQETNKNV